MRNKITIYNTPIISHFFKFLATHIFKLSGWKLTGEIPDEDKMVVIMAPHTSNWDMPVALLLAFAFKIQPNWLGKSKIFSFQFKNLMKWLGGIPIDRSKSRNFVDEAALVFKREEKLLLSLSPEGTRKKVSTWKSGFYYIASKADVPILCAYIDYSKKEAGFETVIIPSGDPEKDLIKIRNFYSSKSGKNPEQFNPAGIEFKK